MLISTAYVRTTNASINLKKLCRHFSHKMEVTFDDRSGEIRFPFGGSGLLTAEGDTLCLQAQADAEDTLTRTERVLGDHLLRFANKESLEVQWRRGAPADNP